MSALFCIFLNSRSANLWQVRACGRVISTLCTVLAHSHSILYVSVCWCPLLSEAVLCFAIKCYCWIHLSKKMQGVSEANLHALGNTGDSYGDVCRFEAQSQCARFSVSCSCLIHNYMSYHESIHQICVHRGQHCSTWDTPHRLIRDQGECD